MDITKLRNAITAWIRVATQSSHPASPSAGYGIFYDKNKSPYFKNSDGAEMYLGVTASATPYVLLRFNPRSQ